MAEKVMAVVPAAGAGLRMGGDTAKQFRLLGGRPVLTRALEAVAKCQDIKGIIVAVPQGQEEAVWEQCVRPYDLDKVLEVIAGGRERQDSVSAATLRAAQRGATWVVVHDAVRPLAPPALFGAVLAAAQEVGAAVTALPAFDTVKKDDGAGLVRATLDRRRLWLVQTPQAFSVSLLREAQSQAALQGFYATDEAGLIEWLGREVKLVEGARQNFKLTTPEDLRLAEGWLLAGEGAAPAAEAAPALRVGSGQDAHRLVEGRALILGGVKLDHPQGLLGHSDADVLTHAVMDALLAAAGLGDIGRHFPDSDPAYQDADSLKLLERVVGLLQGAGWRPHQVSATVLAQEPRLAPHFPAMTANLQRALNLAPGWVNLAATTSEGMGFTGRGEGIAASATATIVPL